VVISPKYSRFYVTYEDGEYLIHYNEESRPRLSKVKEIRDAAVMITDAWERGEPLPGDLSRFRKLLEWNGIILAAHDGERGLHFVTWQYRHDRQSACNGSYTDDIAVAMRDFVGRSGLYPRRVLFNHPQLNLIRTCIAFSLENDDELYPGTVEILKSMLSDLDDYC